MTKLRAIDGAILGTVPTGDVPLRAVFDGASIWISNAGDGTASKM